MRPRKVIIVGAGFMGDVHAKAYAGVDRVEIAGFVDTNIQKCDTMAQKYSARAFASIKEAAAFEADFADICLPTRFHKDAAIEAFNSGLDVICEKPISIIRTEAEDMQAVAKEKNRKFMIAQVVRFWPEYLKLHEMKNAGMLEDIISATFTRYGSIPMWSEANWMHSDKLTGGAIFDLTIHDIDYCLWLFGKPEWVFAKKSMFCEDYMAYVNVILGYKKFNILLESGFGMAEGYPFTAGFRISTGKKTYEYINKSGIGLLEYGEGKIGARMEYADHDPYMKELQYFVSCMNEGRSPSICTAEDAINSIRLAELISESAKNEIKVEVDY